MSLILEALRKSEAERQRGRAPEVHAALSTPPVARQSRPRWWLAIGVVGLAGAAAATMLWRDRLVAADTATNPPPALSTTAADTPAPVSTTPPANSTPPADRAATPPVDTTVRQTAPSAAARASSATPAPIVTPGARANAATAAVPNEPPALAPEAAAIEPAAVDEPRLHRLGELDSSTRAQLPALKVSMHVWNEDPQQRFAIIDGQRLGEGAQIGDTVIERISRDGVVLDWRGQRLLLPRP